MYSFAQWLAVLDRYAGADLTYFNSAGIIPEGAILPARTKSHSKNTTRSENARTKKPRRNEGETGDKNKNAKGNENENGNEKEAKKGEEKGIETPVEPPSSTRRANPFRERRRFDATDFRVGGVGDAAFANVALESALGEDVSEEDVEGEGEDVEMRED